MKKRQISAEEIFGKLGSTCLLLEKGQVLKLYPKNQTPESVKSRAYGHVVDTFALYQVGELYVLEFREQCNQTVVYRALLLSSQPDSGTIGELFHSHLGGHGAAGIYALADFDQLAELTSDRQDGGQKSHPGRRMNLADQRAILTCLGLTFTGLAMTETKDRQGKPTTPLARLGLGLMGSGFLYLRKALKETDEASPRSHP